MLRKLPAKDHPKLAAGSRTKTCALVGNSGNLLLYEHGKEIDAHDLIWRFNGGKTKGFQKQVSLDPLEALFRSPCLSPRG